MNYTNIYGLRVVLTDGVTYQQAAAGIRNRLDCGHNLAHRHAGRLARRAENGSILLSPSEVDPIENNFSIKLGVNCTWLQ
ncbi:MAG: hypothetical protein IPN33_25005 [Saprospiraceae bacterium]|nr:hypothetical protein [Saprospiraceae bacterium]